MRSTTETLIAAMRILANDIESGDGVANAAIAEAGERLEEQARTIASQLRVIEGLQKRLTQMAVDSAIIVQEWPANVNKG